MKENVKRFVLTLKYLKETLAIILSFDTNVLVQYLESLELFLLSPSIKYESAGTTHALRFPPDTACYMFLPCHALCGKFHTPSDRLR